MGKTCPHCGYEINHCRCGDGETGTTPTVQGRFNYYSDMADDSHPYARTSPINRSGDARVKHYAELAPLDNELVLTWINRTAKHSAELAEHSRWHHLYGTRKPWACHTSGRYCFICTLCDLNDNLRELAVSFIAFDPNYALRWHVAEDIKGKILLTISK